MISRLLIALACLCGDNMPLSSDIVTVKVGESVVHADESSWVEVEVSVKEGYHIQANKVNDESLIPTTLEIKNDKFLTISKQEFPPSKQFKLEGTNTSLNVYDGKFLIKLFLDSVKNAVEGKYVLAASLRYQACDSRSCLFPRTIDFTIPIEVMTKK